MLLSALAQALGDELLERRGDCEIASMSMDNRKFRTLDRGLFFCVPGARFDGHDFAERAVADGACWAASCLPQLMNVSAARTVTANAARHANPLCFMDFLL